MYSTRAMRASYIRTICAYGCIVRVGPSEVAWWREAIHTRAPCVRTISPARDRLVRILGLAVDREAPRGTLGLFMTQRGLDAASSHHDTIARRGLFKRVFTRRVALARERWGRRERSEAVVRRQTGICVCMEVTLVR